MAAKTAAKAPAKTLAKTAAMGATPGDTASTLHRRRFRLRKRYQPLPHAAVLALPR